MARRHGWAYRLITRLEYDPDTQFNFHRAAVLFWMLNAMAGVTVYLVWPHLWVAIGVLYVFLLSIYANADTDYDAMSASLAAKHAKRAADQGEPK